VSFDNLSTSCVIFSHGIYVVNEATYLKHVSRYSDSTKSWRVIICNCSITIQSGKSPFLTFSNFCKNIVFLITSRDWPSRGFCRKTPVHNNLSYLRRQAFAFKGFLLLNLSRSSRPAVPLERICPAYLNASYSSVVAPGKR